MKTRTGKIARLPRAIRNQLNTCLQDGEPGQRLLEWLNALPEVQAVLAAEFEGRPILAQNLSDWKKGGHREWVLTQEAQELAQSLAEDAVELQAVGRPPLTDTLAIWLAARFAVATRGVTAQDGPERWRLLRELCADVVKLRRGDHSAERLRLEREHLELAREREREITEEEMRTWAMEHKEQIDGRRLTPEERLQAYQRIFGMEDGAPLPPRHRASRPASPEAPATIQGYSRLIKPGEKNMRRRFHGQEKPQNF